MIRIVCVAEICVNCIQVIFRPAVWSVNGCGRVQVDAVACCGGAVLHPYCVASWPVVRQDGGLAFPALSAFVILDEDF